MKSGQHRLHRIGKQKKTIGIMRSSGKNNEVEWVVRSELSSVRSEPDVSAAQIDCKSKGGIVIGNQQGDWLQLTHERGWMLIEFQGDVMLQRRTVAYFQG